MNDFRISVFSQLTLPHHLLRFCVHLSHHSRKSLPGRESFCNPTSFWLFNFLDTFLSSLSGPNSTKFLDILNRGNVISEFISLFCHTLHFLSASVLEMSVLWVGKKGGWVLCWVSFTALWPRQQKGQQKQPETAHLLPTVTTSDAKPTLFQKHWTSCQKFQSARLTPGTMCV